MKKSFISSFSRIPSLVPRVGLPRHSLILQRFVNSDLFQRLHNTTTYILFYQNSWLYFRLLQIVRLARFSKHMNYPYFVWVTLYKRKNNLLYN